jgi:GH35 family endo-1,4-beta-xylanase
LAAFARANNQRLHGHTLIWHQQLPGWMTGFSGNADAWEALFRDHIQTICRHFRGQVTSWDVVNEAFDADGGLRSTIWSQHLGGSYLEKAGPVGQKVGGAKIGGWGRRRRAKRNAGEAWRAIGASTKDQHWAV